MRSFDDVASTRRDEYAKDADDESFVRGLNEQLAPRELELYVECEIEHPFVFVVGLPRSGTTLLSQLLAYSLDAGYVTNFAARFWLAPVHGLRLGRILFGTEKPDQFESDYARTADPREIHEFGYFWRHWLRKETFGDIVRSRELESTVDWDGLRLTLANIQRELGRPYVGKNMLGAYHMAKLNEVLGEVLWVHIERDPLDVAVSILDARRKHYEDLRSWWSYVPLEYDAAGRTRRVAADRRPGPLSRSAVRDRARIARRSCRPDELRAAVPRSGRRAVGDLSAQLDPDRRLASGLVPAAPVRRSRRREGPLRRAARRARQGELMGGTMAMHQPNYVPWLGYFHKLADADWFVHLDAVQFPRGQSFAARNRIKTPNGVAWLTVPVSRPHGRDGRVSYGEVGFADAGWRDKHLKTVEMSYRRAPFFDEVFAAVRDRPRCR